MRTEFKQRHSRQRELVRSVLFSGALYHPTANEVYAKVKRKDYNVSLGTVYRNLNLMSDNGEILKISGIDSCDRFDFQVIPHAHFKCNHCGKISDIKLSPKHFKSLEKLGFSVDSFETILRGTCPECKKKFSKIKINSTKKGKK